MFVICGLSVYRSLADRHGPACFSPAIYQSNALGLVAGKRKDVHLIKVIGSASVLDRPVVPRMVLAVPLGYEVGQN
jgi:hypothetical protein